MSEVSLEIRIQLCIEDILRKRVPLFDGVESLLALCQQVPAVASSRDVRLLGELLAKADHLPIGAARANWSADALHEKDRELLELERLHEDSAFYACRRLLQTVGG